MWDVVIVHRPTDRLLEVALSRLQRRTTMFLLLPLLHFCVYLFTGLDRGSGLFLHWRRRFGGGSPSDILMDGFVACGNDGRSCIKY